MILLMTAIELLIYLFSSLFRRHPRYRLSAHLGFPSFSLFTVAAGVGCWTVGAQCNPTDGLLAHYLRVRRSCFLSDNYDPNLIFTFLPYDETEPFRLSIAIDSLWPSNGKALNRASSEHSKYNQCLLTLVAADKCQTEK